MDWIAAVEQHTQSTQWLLLNEAERAMEAGTLQQTEALLLSAWGGRFNELPEFGNYVAWQLARLKLRGGDVAAAVVWLDRIADLPAEARFTWRSQRTLLLEMCSQLQQQPASDSCAVDGVAVPSATGLAPLNVQSLGSFAVRRGNQLLAPCNARKAITLLRYLLSRPHHSASREELMDLLWPDATPRRAAHSLHVTVSALRHYLDHQPMSYLLFSAGHYTLNPAAALHHDCAAFMAASDQAERLRHNGDLAAAQQAYVQAISFYGGDYVVDDPDQPWAIVERERLLSRYLAVLEQLGTIWMTRSCFEHAAECFQLLLQRDEYREDIHCQVMRCYLQLGRRNHALRQYQICAKTLADDLGLDPMPETAALYRQVLAGGNG